MLSLSKMVKHLLVLHYSKLGAKCRTSACVALCKLEPMGKIFASKSFAGVALCLACSNYLNICLCCITLSLKQSVKHLLMLHLALSKV